MDFKMPPPSQNPKIACCWWCHVSLCLDNPTSPIPQISSTSLTAWNKACTILSIFHHTRQEHSVTLMLRKKEKDLETEYKQLQLESQGKEGRLIALRNEVEVKKKILLFHMSGFRTNVRVEFVSFHVLLVVEVILRCLVFLDMPFCRLVACCVWLSVSLFVFVDLSSRKWCLGQCFEDFQIIRFFCVGLNSSTVMWAHCICIHRYCMLTVFVSYIFNILSFVIIVFLWWHILHEACRHCRGRSQVFHKTLYILKWIHHRLLVSYLVIQPNTTVLPPLKLWIFKNLFYKKQRRNHVLRAFEKIFSSHCFLNGWPSTNPPSLLEIDIVVMWCIGSRTGEIGFNEGVAILQHTKMSIKKNAFYKFGEPKHILLKVPQNDC